MNRRKFVVWFLVGVGLAAVLVLLLIFAAPADWFGPSVQDRP